MKFLKKIVIGCFLVMVLMLGSVYVEVISLDFVM